MSQIFKPFKEHIASPGCRGVCERHELVTVPKRYKGYTAQEQGIKRCSKCSVHYKPGVGLRCPCCNTKLAIRYRSKQSRAYREKAREKLVAELVKQSEDDRLNKARQARNYYVYGCRGCDFHTQDIEEWKLHKSPGHRTKVIPIPKYLIPIEIRTQSQENIQEN